MDERRITIEMKMRNEITTKEAIETLEKLTAITGKQYFFKANKGGIKLMTDE